MRVLLSTQILGLIVDGWWLIESCVRLMVQLLEDGVWRCTLWAWLQFLQHRKIPRALVMPLIVMVSAADAFQMCAWRASWPPTSVRHLSSFVTLPSSPPVCGDLGIQPCRSMLLHSASVPERTHSERLQMSETRVNCRRSSAAQAACVDGRRQSTLMKGPDLKHRSPIGL